MGLSILTYEPDYLKLKFRDEEWHRLVTLLPNESRAGDRDRHRIECSAYLLIDNNAPRTRAEWISAHEKVLDLTKRLKDALYVVADEEEYDCYYGTHTI